MRGRTLRLNSVGLRRPAHSSADSLYTQTGNNSRATIGEQNDFSKAFDLVDHSILLSKLKGKNINRFLWQWIQSFLQGRMQQVKLPGALSTTRTCPAGVPQGSVISPLLFGIFIDDFDDSIPVEMQGRVKMCKYADDCTAS